MTENVYLTYYQKNKESILAKTKEYYKKKQTKKGKVHKQKKNVTTYLKKGKIK